MRYVKGIAGLSLGAMILAMPSLSLGAPRCGDTADLDQTLTPAKGFIRLGRGATTDGTIIDIYTAPMTAAWVAVARLSPSRSCIITEGKNWQSDVPFSLPAIPDSAPTLPTQPGASS